MFYVHTIKKRPAAEMPTTKSDRFRHFLTLLFCFRPLSAIMEQTHSRNDITRGNAAESYIIMPDTARFTARFGDIACPAALYSTEGSFVCCNTAAEAFPAAFLQGLFAAQRTSLHALQKGESTAFTAPCAPNGGTVSAFPFDGDIVCLFAGGAQSIAPQGADHYFAAVRESVFQNCLALTSLQRKINSDDPETEQLFDTVRTAQYAALRDARNLAALAAGCAGTQAFNPVCIDLAALVSALCEAANTVKNSRTPITVQGCDTPLPIMADRSLLERALLNLLANALQYTRDGNSITVSLRVQSSSAVITVADHGAGMLPQTLAQATEPFFSAEPAADGGARPGLGLGLTVAKRAAELHGGSLLLTGEYGEGTTAALTLPIPPCGSDTLRSKSASYTADSFSGLYIELCRICTLPH